MWRAIGEYLCKHGQTRAYRRFLIQNLPGVLAMKLGLIPAEPFKNSWLLKQAALLAGAPANDMTIMSREIAACELWPKRRTSLVTELVGHAKQGRVIVLASGMYEEVLGALAQYFTPWPVLIVGTVLAYNGGIFTGSFQSPVCVGLEKKRRVQELLASFDPDGAPVIVAAYGDTVSDVPLLELAADPVAVSPQKALAKIARERGWRILATTREQSSHKRQDRANDKASQ